MSLGPVGRELGAQGGGALCAVRDRDGLLRYLPYAPCKCGRAHHDKYVAKAPRSIERRWWIAIIGISN